MLLQGQDPLHGTSRGIASCGLIDAKVSRDKTNEKMPFHDKFNSMNGTRQTKQRKQKCEQENESPQVFQGFVRCKKTPNELDSTINKGAFAETKARRNGDLKAKKGRMRETEEKEWVGHKAKVLQQSKGVFSLQVRQSCVGAQQLSDIRWIFQLKTIASEPEPTEQRLSHSFLQPEKYNNATMQSRKHTHTNFFSVLFLCSAANNDFPVTSSR